MAEIDGSPARFISSGTFLGMKAYGESLKDRGHLLKYKLVIVNGEMCILYGITSDNEIQLTEKQNTGEIFF